MNWLEVEQLLKQFWKGETSRIEEQELHATFLRDDVPNHLKPFKDYFGYVKNNKEIKLEQPDFEAELLEKIRTKNRFTFARQLPYAAALLVLISSVFFLIKNEIDPFTKHQSLTENEIQIVQKYMGLLATNFDQSISLSAQTLKNISLLNKGAQTIQHYENMYQKQIKPLKQIDYIDQSLVRLKHLKTFEKNRIKIPI